MPIIGVSPHYCESERLTFRPLSLKDAKDCAAACQPWEVVQYTTSIPHPYPEDEAQRFIASAQESWRNGTLFILCAQDKQSGAYTGQVGMKPAPDAPGEGELSYLVPMPMWGQGYASEMVKVGLAFGFQTLGLHRIHAIIFSENHASQRVVQKCGLRPFGSRPQDVPMRGRRVDTVLYEITKEEWL